MEQVSEREALLQALAFLAFAGYGGRGVLAGQVAMTRRRTIMLYVSVPLRRRNMK